MSRLFQVTGGNGFIGKHLVSYLEEKNQQVRLIKRDLSNVKNEGTIIHLAAYGNHYNQSDIEQMIKANVTMLKKLINKTKRCDRFINISTSSVLLKKQTAYSFTKKLGERMIDNLQDSRYYNVRPYSVFGKGEADFRFIPTVIRCLQSGETMNLVKNATHDWIYVDDFVKALMNGYQDIGTGIKKKNIEIVKMLQDISGKKLKFVAVKNLRDYDNNNWRCSDGVPSIPLYDALKLTYDSFTR